METIIMKARTLATFAAAGLAALISGCKVPLEKWNAVIFAYADLNKDGRPDKANIVEWNHTYYDYALEISLSNPDGTYAEPRIARRFPYFLRETARLQDYDGDGDLDLVFNKSIRKKSGFFGSATTYVKQYVSRNDGRGNFAEPEYVKLVDFY
ncbi:MAG: hypothetical protein QME12_05505 [Nanoarchaeota archaeon]|nr:hypothetical protein [Nanoarchaeota archaeon]